MHRLDPLLVRRAIDVGTRQLLRAGDAVYATLAEMIGGEVVSWDGELIGRAGAVTPDAWLKRNASEGEEEDEEAPRAPDSGGGAGDE
jgi:predicted nucleic acid-binding protein